MSDTESNIDYTEYEEYRNEYVNEYGHDSENESQFDYQKYIDQKYNENLLKAKLNAYSLVKNKYNTDVMHNNFSKMINDIYKNK